MAFSSRVHHFETESMSSADVEVRNSMPYEYFDVLPFQFRQHKEYMYQMSTFIRQNFKQKECCRFVPRPRQTVGRIIDLRCSCGEIRSEHFFSRFSDTHQQVMAEENRESEPPQNQPPLDKWTSRDIEKQEAKSFGNINFVNVDHIGRKNSAKYIRLSNEDSVNKTLELMKVHWNMMDRHPHLVISVVGGSENFTLNGKMRDTLNKGLIMAAKTTDAWLITSGFNVGVMKLVGQAVQQGQSYFWKNGLGHCLQCIGIVPWGFVKDRHSLEGPSEKSEFTVSIKSSNVIGQGKPLPLNPDHTHFIFVDDGYRNRNDGAAKFRAKLEKKIAAPKTANGLEIPLVMVVVEGGPDVINDALQSLKQGIPVVICAGTGKAADIIAFACSRTKAKQDSELMQCELEMKIVDAFKLNEANDKYKKIREKVEKCCNKETLIAIFDMTKGDDLHTCILLALLNAHSSNPSMTESERESLRMKQLRLALAWDRVDLAQEMIFLENVQWSTGNLETIMTEAIRDDKAEFARLLIQHGIIMEDYLTEARLKELYEMSPSQKLIERVFFKLIGKGNLSIDDLPKLLNELLEKYKWGFKNGRSIRPYKELFIWALLYGRQALAKLCWMMGEEPVTSAIAATMIYDSLSRKCGRHESHLKEQFNNYKREFENLAIRIIDLYHSEDQGMAMDLVRRKSPSWDSVNCMDMAASANDQKFISTAACQNNIGSQWRSGIQSHWLVIMLSAIIPIPFLAIAFLKIQGAYDDNLQKLFTFVSCPIYKFSNSTFWYLTFAVLFTYFILVDFKAYEITKIEVVCVVTICTYIVDELVYMKMLKKIREWYGILKILELLNFFLALVGFIFHNAAPNYVDAKAIYSVNCVIFYIRLTKIFIPNSTLGPKLIMIKRMIEELLQFILVLLIFLLGYGVARHSLLYKHGKGDWETLIDVFYYPYWQLFEPNLDDSTKSDENCMSSYLNTTNTAGDIRSCKTSHWLVYVLLACYLIVGQLLLINLLIAIFSNVFKTVEKNAQEIWKFQMYFVTMEYWNKAFLSPPFNIIVHILRFLNWATERITSKNIDEESDIALYTNILNEEWVNYNTDLVQNQQLLEKEMMVNILNQEYVKMESM